MPTLATTVTAAEMNLLMALRAAIRDAERLRYDDALDDDAQRVESADPGRARKPLAKAAGRAARGPVLERLQEWLSEHGPEASIQDAAAAIECHRTSVLKNIQAHPDILASPHTGYVSLKKAV